MTYGAHALVLSGPAKAGCPVLRIADLNRGAGVCRITRLRGRSWPPKYASKYPSAKMPITDLDHEIDEGAHLGRQQPRCRIDDVDRQWRLLELRQHDFQRSCLDRLRGLIGQHPGQAAILRSILDRGIGTVGRQPRRWCDA